MAFKMQSGPDGPMLKNYGAALNMGKHTKTKTGKHKGPGGKTTKGPHAHKDGETSVKGVPQTREIPVQTPIQKERGELTPYDSKPKGRIKKAIKKLVSKFRKKGCEPGEDCGAFA